MSVVDRVLSQLDAVRKRLASTGRQLELTVVTDQARYIRQAVSDVIQTALIGGLLAVLVLAFFLHSFKSTAIIAVSIPISVVASFLLMYLSHVSLNIMSLGGLTLGIGLLVDNSIVVLEAIQRRRDEGMGAVEAARTGAGEVGQAVVASTLTTICVFVPIVFVEGVAGQLFGDQALTVTYSLSVSLVVALTIIPMLASRQLRPRDASAPPPRGRLQRGLHTAALAGVRLAKAAGSVVGGVASLLFAVPFRVFDLGYTWLQRVYPVLLDRALDRPAKTLGLVALLFFASLALIPTLGTELVPELVQGEFYVDAELPPGTNLDVTARRLAGIERAARKLDGVNLVYAVAGTSRQQGGIAGELRENLGPGDPARRAPGRPGEGGRPHGRPAAGAGPWWGPRLPLRTALLLQLQDPDRARDPGLQPAAPGAARGRGRRQAASDPGAGRRQVLDRGRESGAADPLRPRAARRLSASPSGRSPRSSAPRCWARWSPTSRARTARSTSACARRSASATAPAISGT